MKTKFDLTRFEDNSDRTMCTVSVFTGSIISVKPDLPLSISVHSNEFQIVSSTAICSTPYLLDKVSEHQVKQFAPALRGHLGV